jgi:FMN-dependent NADH-azoreductase
MNLLHIDSSLLGPSSATRELTAALVAQLQAASPGMDVVRRDLDARPLPHLNGALLGGADADGARESAVVLEEFLAADTVVIGAPMYNFSIPSSLKAWIDRISVAGRTFRYTADGPQGLAGGKRMIVAVAAGGLHAGQPSDFVEPYLRQVFGFLGITDIRFVRADGVALSPEHRRAALDAAIDAARTLPRAA